MSTSAEPFVFQTVSGTPQSAKPVSSFGRGITQTAPAPGLLIGSPLLWSSPYRMMFNV